MADEQVDLRGLQLTVACSGRYPLTVVLTAALVFREEAPFNFWT